MIITTIWIVGRQIIKSAKFTSTKRIIASSISLIARAIMKPVRRKLLIECAHKVKLHATYAPVRTNAAPVHAKCFPARSDIFSPCTGFFHFGTKGALALGHLYRARVRLPPKV